MTRLWCAMFLLVSGPMCSAVHAHGGRLNAEGCHNNRKTGDYHCHRSSYQPPASAQGYRTGQNLVSGDRASGAGTSSNRPFANCAQARAAGAAPVRRGEPGYGPHLDRDGDGIGCEPYRGRR